MFMNAILLCLYAAACVAYAVQFAQRTFGTSRVATVLLVLAAFAHTFVIGMETMRVGHVPSASATAAILSFVWLLALSYLYIELTTGERAMGVFILPLLVALQAIPAFSAVIDEPRSVILESPWFGVHVSSLLFAYASFALAAVLGITYVLQFKEIKRKDLGFLLRAAAVAQRARRDERARGEDRMALPDGRADHRRHLGFTAPLVRRSERVDVDGRSENLRRGALLGGVLVRALRAARHRMARPPRRVALGGRVRHRAAELRAGQLLFHDVP